MNTSDAADLFKELMDLMFENESKRKLYYYKSNEFYFNISEEPGLYSVFLPEGFVTQILKEPNGPEKYKGKSITAPDKKLSDTDSKYLYIGKAHNSLRFRVKEFMKFGYSKGDVSIGHGAGSNLWFINNNKNLYINQVTLDEIKETAYDTLYKPAEELTKQFKQTIQNNLPNIIFAGLIELHKLAYNGLSPFGLREINKTRNDFKDYWSRHWYNL